MRRVWFILLLLVLASFLGCPGKRPAPPITPDPSPCVQYCPSLNVLIPCEEYLEKCKDIINPPCKKTCEDGSKINCEDECPVVIPPDDSCDKYTSTTNSSCKQIESDHTTERLIGVYVGVMGTPGFDWVRFVTSLHEFTGAVFHPSPWEMQGEDGNWMVVCKNGKCDLRKKNPAYYEHLQKGVDVFGFYDKTFVHTVLDQYCDEKWQDARYLPYIAKIHPWRNNTDGVNRCRQINDLYGVSLATNDPVNVAIREYIAETAKIFAVAIKKRPHQRIWIRPANEPSVFINSSGGVENGRGNPFSDSNFKLVFDIFEKHGVKQSEYVRFVVQKEFMRDGKFTDIPATDKWYKGFVKQNGYMIEFHGVTHVEMNASAEGEALELFTKILKIPAKDLFPSNDGDHGENDGTYYPRLSDFSSWQIVTPGSTMDYKLPSDTAGCTWKKKDIQTNTDCYIPQMEANIFHGGTAPGIFKVIESTKTTIKVEPVPKWIVCTGGKTLEIRRPGVEGLREYAGRAKSIKGNVITFNWLEGCDKCKDYPRKGDSLYLHCQQ